MSANFHRRNIPQRRGAVLICMLACCLTALALSVTSVRLALRSARESKQVLKLRQTEWLLKAGLMRAKQNLYDAQYTGETWELPADVTGSEAAVIWITVEPNTEPNKPETITLAITAAVGTAPQALRRSCKLTIATLPALGSE